MKLKHLFTISAVILGLLGLGLIIFPGPLMTLRTGSNPDLLTAHVASQFGIAILTLAVISWFARNRGNSGSRNVIVVGLSLLYILLPIGLVISILRGSESAEGFILVIIFALLAAGFIIIGKPNFKRL